MSRACGAKAPVDVIVLHFESTSISIRNRVTADFIGSNELVPSASHSFCSNFARDLIVERRRRPCDAASVMT